MAAAWYFPVNGVIRLGKGLRKVLAHRCQSSSTIIKEGIAGNDAIFLDVIIPKRKERDSLSVLKALASTVKNPTDSPHYGFMDDPYLIPMNDFHKKMYAMCKESGRKSARYILENYAEYFTKNDAIPSVEMFMPPQKSYSHTIPSKEALIERIEKRKVIDAIDMYKAICSDTTDDVRRQLLELLCVFNGQDPSDRPSYVDSYYHIKHQDSHRKTWKDEGWAERVFEEISVKTCDDYNNLICGFARYLNCEKAFALYAECFDKKILVYRRTLNELIRIISFHFATVEEKWGKIVTLLTDMKGFDVRPDMSTFISVFFTLTRMSLARHSADYFLSVLKEMEVLGMEPCICIWKFVLMICYPNDHTESNVLPMVIDRLEDKGFDIRYADDVNFFLIAMSRCAEQLQDVELAHRIHRLLMSKNHKFAFLGSSAEHAYFNYYLRLVCNFSSLDRAMELYHELTPHLMTPSETCMEELLRMIELQDGYSHLPVIWSDFAWFHFTRKEGLVDLILQIMSQHKEEDELQTQFHHAAQSLFDNWHDMQDERIRQKPILTTGSMVGRLVTIALNSGDADLAWELYAIFRNNRRVLSGVPSEASLLMLVKSRILCKRYGEAVEVVRLMDSEDMMRKGEAGGLVSSCPEAVLSDDEKEFVSAL